MVLSNGRALEKWTNTSFSNASVNPNPICGCDTIKTKVSELPRISEILATDLCGQELLIAEGRNFPRSHPTRQGRFGQVFCGTEGSRLDSSSAARLIQELRPRTIESFDAPFEIGQPSLLRDFYL